ncbi:MAG: hypothetical protein R6U96_07805 [Promethearchaeia archaeon]
MSFGTLQKVYLDGLRGCSVRFNNYHSTPRKVFQNTPTGCCYTV